MSSRSRAAGRLLTVLSLAAIAFFTLRPRPELAPLSAETPVWCLVCGASGVVDVILNVLLFVPLGVGLALAAVPAVRAVLVAAAVTLTVELLQLSIVSGRDASLSDLVTNTLGAWLGVVLARRWREVLLPPPHVAARLALAWGAFVVGVAVATGVSVAPSMPAPPYWGQWTPELAGFAQHQGEVVSAVVEDIEVPSHRLRDSPALADSLADGELSASVAARLRQPTRLTAPIFRLVDGEGEQLLLTAQRGTDLIVETGTRSERFRLRTLTLHLPAALPVSQPAEIEVSSTPREYRITLKRPGSTRTFVVTRSVTWGWALLSPFWNRIGEHHRLLDAVWLAGLMLPLGWWAGVTGRRGRGALLCVGVLAAALAGAPAALGLSPAGFSSWVGGAIGAIAAALGARLVTPDTKGGS